MYWDSFWLKSCGVRALRHEYIKSTPSAVVQGVLKKILDVQKIEGLFS